MSQLSKDEHMETLRWMAWERAKGELKSIGYASYSGKDEARKERMIEYFNTLNDFISVVEDKDLLS